MTLTCVNLTTGQSLYTATSQNKEIGLVIYTICEFMCLSFDVFMSSFSASLNKEIELKMKLNYVILSWAFRFADIFEDNIK